MGSVFFLHSQTSKTECIRKLAIPVSFANKDTIEIPYRFVLPTVESLNVPGLIETITLISDMTVSPALIVESLTAPGPDSFRDMPVAPTEATVTIIKQVVRENRMFVRIFFS
jgi:hypothetical protein